MSGGTAPAVVEAGRAPGRVCPNDYRYPPTVFARPAELTAEILYVVGGLYGNLQALDAVERLAAAEPKSPTIVLNGDFHWFDAEPDWFAAVEARAARWPALRGNVETEIARRVDAGFGCGCAYPEPVAEAVVARSNDILDELRAVAQRSPAAGDRLRGLPMHLVAQVGDARVGVVHGDATALAGWGFGREALDDPGRALWLTNVRRASGIDVFASTHTCGAALRQFALAGGLLTVANNGAAGMPNFRGDPRGLITRIARTPAPLAAVYGLRHGSVFVDALAVPYDADAFRGRFLARWPVASPAHLSYWDRIVAGPNDRPADAAPR